MLLLHKELMILIINKVEICGVNTSKLPVIKEKKELIIKMSKGATKIAAFCVAKERRISFKEIPILCMMTYFERSSSISVSILK